MIISIGRIRKHPERTGFRNDFCLTCCSPQRAQRIKTEDYGTVYSLPVLPLGYKSRWHCFTCGAETKDPPGGGVAWTIVGALVLLAIAVSILTLPSKDNEDRIVGWVVGGAFLLGLAWTLRVLWRELRIKSHAKQFREIAPTEDTYCWFCRKSLASTPNWHCVHCGCERH